MSNAQVKKYESFRIGQRNHINSPSDPQKYIGKYRKREMDYDVLIEEWVPYDVLAEQFPYHPEFSKNLGSIVEAINKNVADMKLIIEENVKTIQKLEDRVASIEERLNK